MNQNTKSESGSSSPSSDLLGMRFRISRKEYPEHFCGFNGIGPMWTSSEDDAEPITPKDLGIVMVALGEHVSAALMPNRALSQAGPATNENK